jgi:acyl carrier protein
MVIDIISEELGIEVTDETRLDDLDSLEFLSLMVRLGIPKEQYVNVDTVADIRRIVAQL